MSCSACGCPVSNEIRLFSVQLTGNRARKLLEGQWEAAATQHGLTAFAINPDEEVAKNAALDKLRGMVERKTASAKDNMDMLEKVMST